MPEKAITARDSKDAWVHLTKEAGPPIGECWACERAADCWLVVSPQMMSLLVHGPDVHTQFHKVLGGHHAVLRISEVVGVSDA